MAESDNNEQNPEPNPNDRKQAILIAAVTAFVVFAVLTGGLLAVKSAFGPSKKPATLAKATKPAEKTATSQPPAPASPTTESPAESTPELPAATRPEDAAVPIPGLPPAERPLPIPNLPPPKAVQPPTVPDDENISESSFITGEIVPFDPKFLEVTEEDIRRRKAMALESSLDSYQERLAELEEAIVKHTASGARAEVAELKAIAAETRASIAGIQASLAKVGPVGEDPFAGVSKSPPVAGLSPRPSPGASPHLSPRPSPRPSRKRVARPSSELQQTANKQLEDIFDFSKSKTDADQLKLAKELYGLSKNAPADSAERFVILRKTAELASAGGDAVLMVEAIDAMGRNFEMDTLVAKGKMLKQFADGANTSTKIGSLVKAAQRYAGQALGAEKLEFAESIATLTYQVCQRPQGKDFRKEALDFRRHVQKICGDQAKLKTATTAIEANPEDAGAHLALGQLYCFGRGDWRRGLTHLAKGSDAGLATAAQTELKGPSSTAERVVVGDAWWDAAKPRTGDEKKNLMLHAAYWYRKALPGLSGLDKARVGKRLGQIEELAEPKAAKGRETEREKPRPSHSRTPKHPPGSVQFGGHWYKGVGEPKLSWAQAQQACQQMGGYPVSIESPAEAQFIGQLAGRGDAWIGAVQNERKQWGWITGRPMAYSNWNSGEPNGSGPRAVLTGAGWKDRAGTQAHGFICEWDR